jgi:hypothetical protein
MSYQSSPSDVRAVTRNSAITRIVVLGSLVATALGILIPITAVVMSVYGKNVPDVISNWGGVIVGFYFGTFASILKDYMSHNMELEKVRYQNKAANKSDEGNN